jgi:hypothetical protein
MIVIAIGLALPGVNSGFALDDYFMLGELSKHTAPYDLYHFVAAQSVPQRVATGLLPWWANANLDIHLFRPLTSLLMSADYRVFGGWAVGYHLHSIVWFSILLLLVRVLFRRVLDPTTALLALTVFALSPCLSQPAGWLAARHLLVAAVPVATGLVLLTRDLRFRRWLAGAAFVIALCASEAGLGGLSFWAAYEFFGPDLRSGRRRWYAAAPVALGILYLVVYRLAGVGVHGSGLYLDPLSNPVGYLRAAPVRIALQLGNALFGIDGGAGLVWPKPMAMLSLAIVVLVIWLSVRLWGQVTRSERAQLQWLVPGALIATVAAVGGTPGARALVIPQLGFAPLLAVLMRHGWRRLTNQDQGVAPHVVRAFAILLGLVHLALAPLITLANGKGFRNAVNGSADIAQQMVQASGRATRVVLLTGSDPMVWLYALTMGRMLDPDAGNCWWAASAARSQHRIEAIGSRQIRIDLAATALLAAPFEQLHRNPTPPISPGTQVTQCGAVIRVLGAGGAAPARLEVTLPLSLDDPSLVLLAWRNGRIERISSAELQRGLSIPWSPGPMRLL